MSSATVEAAPVTSGPPLGGTQYNTNQAGLDDSYYQLDDVELQFLSTHTGIFDAEELKKHVLAVQKELYAVSAQCSYSERCLSFEIYYIHF
jgi:hypothetical protein